MGLSASPSKRPSLWRTTAPGVPARELQGVGLTFEFLDARLGLLHPWHHHHRRGRAVVGGL